MIGQEPSVGSTLKGRIKAAPPVVLGDVDVVPVAGTLRLRLLRGDRDLAGFQSSGDQVGFPFLQGKHVLSTGAVIEDLAQDSEGIEDWARSGESWGHALKRFNAAPVLDDCRKVGPRSWLCHSRPEKSVSKRCTCTQHRTWLASWQRYGLKR